MHLHEFLQSLMFWIAIVPVIVVLADWVYMLYRNGKLYIDDSPRAWCDGQYRYAEWMMEKFEENFYAVYAIVSCIILFFTEIASNLLPSGEVSWYARHLEQHGNDFWCGWGFFNIMIPALYLFCVLGFLVIRGSLNHLRTIRRLEKARAGKPIPKAKPTKSDEHDIAEEFIKAFGGEGNIRTVRACITRLRVEVFDESIVDQTMLKELGAAGVIIVAGGVQVILGTKSEKIANSMNAVMN